jgi:hypothetical protein
MIKLYKLINITQHFICAIFIIFIKFYFYFSYYIFSFLNFFIFNFSFIKNRKIIDRKLLRLKISKFNKNFLELTIILDLIHENLFIFSILYAGFTLILFTFIFTV